MGRSNLVFRLAVVAVLLAFGTAMAFQNTGESKSARVTKQKYLSDYESRVLLQRSPAWEKFKADFGENVRVMWNVNSDTPHRIVTPGLKLTQDLDNSNIKTVSDEFVNRYSDLLGVKLSDLSLQTAGFHGRMWYVIYGRNYNGIPVYNALVRLTYSSDGSLVSFGADTYPGIKLDTNPGIDESQAVDIVRREVGSTSPEDKALSTRLLVLPLEIGDDYSAHLAWEIEYFVADPLARWFMYVDAHSGEILMYWDAIAYTFTGNVNGDVQLNGAYDTFVNQPFKDQTVNASGHGSDVTDASGNYSISGSGSATITAQLLGPYINVNRYDGGDANFSQSSSGVLNINWTSISQPQERDAFYHAMVIHDYIKYVDPSFTGMDFVLPCNVNVPGSCNAYWNGTSINFYAAGGGCPNIAQMSTVVYHEYGHGITELFYYPVNLPYSDETGGLNEGWSDFIAGCISDQPLMGRGWSGPGTYLRSNDNTAQYPGADCYGEPHCMGDIMVGALWDMRMNLISTYGDGIKPYVDSLWHYARYAKPLTYLDYLWELLLYDDDNGNPLDGTPNYYDICDGFAQHNMDCPALQVGVFITHTPLDNTPSTSDYQVDAVITSTDGTITSANVYWSIGGGYTPVAMTNIGGDNWRGYIPGQPLCTNIDYYIQASDNLGYTARDPEVGSHSFFIGFTNVMFSDDIESGQGSWTHYAVSGSADEWAIRNHRNHTSGGTYAWKLGSAANPGTYLNNEDAGLVTPSTYITNGAELSFWMWGDIEQSSSTSAWDGALVEISINGGGFTQLTPTVGGYTHTSNGNNSWPSGTPCWSGAFGWMQVVCDLSSYANNNIRVRYRFSSDGLVTYEGWYIDDVEITSLDCTPVALGWLNGTVTDINGPVAGVQVYADDGLGHTGSDITLGDGTYFMELQEGTFDVSYTHPEHLPVNLTGVVVVESTTTTQNVYMDLIPEPNIGVFPASISGQAPVGGSDTDVLTISNSGDADLTFNAVTSVNPISPAAGLAAYDNSKASAQLVPLKDKLVDKPAYEGPPNIPDPNVILQGGDNIGSATVITSLPYNDNGTTSGYTNDYDETCPYSGSTSPDVVYAYTPTSSVVVDITLCNGSSYDTKLYLYENSYNPGSPYACNDDACPGYVSEILDLYLTGGNTYYIVIDGYGGDYGSYVLDITEDVPPAPMTCPPEGTLYSQNPHLPSDSWTAGTSDSAPAENYLRYESFSGITSPISEITFWGLDLYFNGSSWVDCIENPMPLTITFYQDNAGQPGSVVQTYSDVSITLTGTAQYYSGFELMYFNTSLSPATNLSSGWVSIQGGGDPYCWFLWMSSGTGDASSLFWDGTSLTTVAYDLSICLGGSGSAWLSLDSYSGTVPPSQNTPITVTMDATGLSAGSYSGNINVSSNDPDEPSIDVPVSFIVGTQTPGTITGTVSDINGPVEGVQVFADDGLGNTGSDVTLSDGSYSMSVLAGTYTVDFSHTAHRDTTVAGVSVTEGGTTVLDVQMEIEQQPSIPTLNEWGMLILSLLLLAAGTVALIRRRKSLLATGKKR